MTFGTLLVIVQLVVAAVIGVIAAALAIEGGNVGSVVVLTGGSTAQVLFILITASAYRARAANDH